MSGQAAIFTLDFLLHYFLGGLLSLVTHLTYQATKERNDEQLEHANP